MAWLQRASAANGFHGVPAFRPRIVASSKASSARANSPRSRWWWPSRRRPRSSALSAPAADAWSIAARRASTMRLGRDAPLETDQRGADVAGQARHVEALGHGEGGHGDLAALVDLVGAGQRAGVHREHLGPGGRRLVGHEGDGLAGQLGRVVLGLGHRERAGEHARAAGRAPSRRCRAAGGRAARGRRPGRGPGVRPRSGRRTTSPTRRG